MEPIYPKGLKEKESRKEYAQKLQTWAKTWLEHISALHPRWDVNERLVIDQPDIPKELPWDGATWVHSPVSSSKGEAWLSFICEPPCSTTPFVIGTIFGKDATRAKSVEQDFYLFMLKGQFPRYFRRTTWQTGLYGKSHWRVTLDFDDYDYPYFKFEDIPARRWIIYPNVTEMDQARMYGHLCEMTLREIEEMQSAGEMYDDVDIRGRKLNPDRAPGGSQNQMESTATITAEDYDRNLGAALDTPGRIAEVFVKEKFEYESNGKSHKDEKYKWYLVRFDMDDAELLGIYEYSFSKPWYFDQFVHEEPDRYWPETSRINGLQSIQHERNAIVNHTLWGMWMQWDPTTYTVGWALDRKYAKNKPGTSVPMLHSGSISQVQSRIDVGAAVMMLQDLDKQADRKIRFGDNQLGAMTSGNRSAAEAEIKQQSAGVAASDDMANINSCISRMMTHCQEMYCKMFPWFWDAYGDILSTKPDEQTFKKGHPALLEKPIQWSLAGTSPDNAPRGQLQAVLALVQGLAQISNPEVLAALAAHHVDTEELIHAFIRNSVVNDRDILIMGQEMTPNQDVQAYIQQHMQSKNAQKGPNPQVEQAKLQIEQGKLSLDQQKLQAEIQTKIIAEIGKIYDSAPADVQRAIESRLGLPSSHIHPVVHEALKSGALHESILKPELPQPSANGKPKAGIIK